MPKFNARPIHLAMAGTAFVGAILCLVALSEPANTRFQSFSAILVAVGTLELAFVTFLQTKQLKFYSDQAQHASLRPLLIPDGELSLETLWTMNHFQLHVRNLHGGPASNVSMVVLPQKAGRKYVPTIYFGRLLSPIASGEKVPIDLNVGVVLIGEPDEISGHPLYAPMSPMESPVQPIARITITCRDVFGLKHATIFDYLRNGTWNAIATLPEAHTDIDDIDDKNQPRPSR